MRRIHLIILYLLIALTSVPVQLFAGNIYWYSGKGHVTYSVQKKHDCVVDKALDMFSADMKAVTGKKAERDGDGVVDVYQLDRTSNKDMQRLKELNVPFMSFITRADAFWLGVRQNRITIVGSNGRGTAYGILELSRLAGVSPWVWWGDVTPERKSRLTLSDRYETMQSPSVAERGISLQGTQWSTLAWDHQQLDKHFRQDALGPKYYHQLFELMLRLRANALYTGSATSSRSHRHIKSDNEVADSFDINVINHQKGQVYTDDGYGYLQGMPGNDQHDGRDNGKLLYHLSYQGTPHDYLWLSTTQPGLIYESLRNCWDKNIRQQWIAVIHDPKVAAYPLSLFMDMAWNINATGPDALKKHLSDWLVQQFGQVTGEQLAKPMTKFYWLCGLRRPEFMGWNQTGLSEKGRGADEQPVQVSELNAEQFGNELERLLNDYQEIEDDINRVEASIPSQLRDAFFAAVKYPVCAAADMATKQLQAQEARTIGRKESFHHDDEALESAVRSWKAYQDIIRLTNYYNEKMANGKWNGLMNMAPRGLQVFLAPTFIDNLTTDELKKYDGYDGIDAPMDDDGCVVRNACDYTSASKDVSTIEMLGHSMKAVLLPKGASISFQFYAPEGDAALRTALIPTLPCKKEQLRYRVTLDSDTTFTYSLDEQGASERWKVNVLRGQAIRTDDVRLSSGTHTLTIQALDDGIIVDQWMLDYDRDRQFYLFPVKPAM